MDNTNQPSQLTSNQVTLFYKLWFGILQHTNELQKTVASMVGKDFHQGINVKDAGKIAKFIWAHLQSFDDYLNSGKLDQHESEIISSWRNHNYPGKFYIVKYLKNGAVFLSTEKTEKSYLVKGLVSALDEMWPKQALPLMVDTVLLPFENEITTCGLYCSSNAILGRNISGEIREACQQAELTYGLITLLPHTQMADKTDKDIAQIKFYLQSAKNLNFYRDDLEDLIHKNPKLYLPIYYQYRGLLEAKANKKEFRKLGIKKLHFALYEAVVIAAHTDRKQVEDTVKKLVPQNKLVRVVYDKV